MSTSLISEYQSSVQGNPKAHVRVILITERNDAIRGIQLQQVAREVRAATDEAFRERRISRLVRQGMYLNAHLIETYRHDPGAYGINTVSDVIRLKREMLKKLGGLKGRPTLAC